MIQRRRRPGRLPEKNSWRFYAKAHPPKRDLLQAGRFPPACVFSGGEAYTSDTG